MTVHCFFQCVKKAAAGNHSRWHISNKCREELHTALLQGTVEATIYTRSKELNKFILKNNYENQTKPAQPVEDNWTQWQKSLNKKITQLKGTEQYWESTPGTQHCLAAPTSSYPRSIQHCSWSQRSNPEQPFLYNPRERLTSMIHKAVNGITTKNDSLD